MDRDARLAHIAGGVEVPGFPDNQTRARSRQAEPDQPVQAEGEAGGEIRTQHSQLQL
jgi:hypothetical protein